MNKRKNTRKLTWQAGRRPRCSNRLYFVGSLFLICFCVYVWQYAFVASNGSRYREESEQYAETQSLYHAHDATNRTSTHRQLAHKLSDLNALPIAAPSFSVEETNYQISPLLTAVLPINHTSTGKPVLEDTLRVLLDQSRYLSRVLLVTPPSLQQQTRRALLSVLGSEGNHAHVEFSMTRWLTGASADSATLTAAREANTDFVLILGDDGLNSIGARDRELLTLLEPFSTTIPIGSRGIVENDSDLSCVAASGVPRPVSFLLPPFVMPVDIIPPTALKEDEMYGVWRTLGKEISLRRSDGVGGYSVGSGDTSRSSWCKSHQDSHAGDTQTPPSLVGSSEVALINPVSAAPTNATCGVHLSALGTFLLVFGSFTELSNFSPAACRLRDEGHTVYALIISSANEQDHSGMQIESCGLGYDIFRQTNSTLQNLRHIVSWTDKQLSLPDVFITSFPSSVLPDDTLSISPLLDATPTVIRIPAADLPYCDWMSSLTVQELRSWHTPQVDISVITNDRPRSLSRLLASLSNARYFGDTPDLRINLEQTADVETLRMVEGFQWDHGRVFLHRRVIHGGLLTAVVESWYPHSNDSYGLILEDDVEVSPLFYAWIKMTLLRYRYGHAKESSSQLFGISLYQQKNLELRPEGRHPFNARNAFAAIGIADPSTPYLSQIPCSWGAIYFPEHWREFHTYLSLRLSESVWDMDQVVVPGVRSNKWTRSWKKYFIELVYLRGYVMLYPNFADFVSLSTNHLEVGSHVKDVPFDAYLRKKKLFLLPLMRLPESPSYETGLIDLPGRSLPPYALLPTLDLLGLHATDEDLLERGQRRRTELTGCKSTVGNQHDAFDLLCVGEAGLDTLRK